MTQQRLFIGLMSGTSGDAIDAALVHFDTAGRPRLMTSHQVALPPSIQSRIFDLQSGLETHIERVCELDVDMADLYTKAVNELLTRSGTDKASIEAVGNHGQTLLHYPNLARALTGIPAIGLLGSSSADGLTISFAPMTIDKSIFSNSSLTSSIS